MTGVWSGTVASLISSWGQMCPAHISFQCFSKEQRAQMHSHSLKYTCRIFIAQKKVL